MEKKNISRRSFVKKSVLSAGAVGLIHPLKASNFSRTEKKLPREVYLASFCSDGLKAETSEQMINIVEGKLQTLFPLQPDIICLPEIFPFFWGVKEKKTIPEQADFSKIVIERFSKLAQKNHVYFICPVVTSESGKYYNAAVLIDRNGKYVGEYRKIHTTIDEMKDGISPGPNDPPVFETDFGKIGIQICYDIRWDDGWKKLQEKGAEIIFWPSAFPGGQLLNARIWQQPAVIVSSVFQGESRIVDVAGQEIAKTGQWQKFWTCASVNLEKAFLHTWPYVNRFDEIQKKYGRKIRIQHFYDEGNSIIESLSADIRIKDVLKEYDINTHVEHIAKADEYQERARKSKNQ